VRRVQVGEALDGVRGELGRVVEDPRHDDTSSVTSSTVAMIYSLERSASASRSCLDVVGFQLEDVGPGG
jgi:hypothetical protein